MQYVHKDIVSMPLLGLIPFLLMTIKSFVGGHAVVSMPLLGLIPFLLLNLRSLRCQHRVSMPLLGLIPFLQREDNHD